ncbi:MAG: hypothetical protein Fur0024_5360 [Patescibacteria group bacterium]
MFDYFFAKLKSDAIGTIGDAFNAGSFSAIGSVEGFITTLFDTAFNLAGLVAVVYLIQGGYGYITSQGESVDKYKKTIQFAVIGLVVVAVSKAFFTFIAKTILGSTL